MSSAQREVLWQPWPGFQTKATECDADEALFGGAAGPGKTDVLVVLAAAHAATYPSAAALFLRTVHKDLLDVVDRMHVMLPPMGFRYNATEGRFHHQGGGTILLGHAESMREAASFLGRQYTGVYWDEIGLLGDPKVWYELSTRVRAPKVFGADQKTLLVSPIPLRMRCSANPGGPGHGWLKKRFVTPCGKDGGMVVKDAVTGLTRAYVPGTLKDNPSLPADYVLRIRGHTEMRRRQLEDGDWDAGEGLAFDVDKASHWVQPFMIPDHWTVFGAHDWGFSHYWTFGLFAADEQGRVVLVDSTSGTGEQPEAIVERVRNCLGRQRDERGHRWDLSRMVQTVAGHDVWNKRIAAGGRTPTLVEQYQTQGWFMSRANIERVLGLDNMRRYLTYRNLDRSPRPPRFTIMATIHNDRVWEMLETRTTDPTDLEDVLKPKEGEDPDGLDDLFDMLRYGLASRPLAALAPMKDNSAAANRHPGYDYTTGRRKPSRTEAALKQFDADRKPAVWSPRMPPVPRTPSVA